MNPFNVLKNVRDSYRTYVESYQNFANDRIRSWVEEHIDEGDLLWREPFIELVRGFRRGAEIQDLVDDPEVDLHPETPDSFGEPKDARDVHPFSLWKHQEEAVRSISGQDRNTIVATGTGSGKTFCFMIPILSRCLKRRDHKQGGIKALIIYPMNALANSQYNEFAARFHRTGASIGLYTGDTEHERDSAISSFQERFGREEPYDSELISREQMQDTPPDVLMTNYQMLEFILTRREDRNLFPRQGGSLEYIVLDELHTYSGMRGADVACLMRRLKEHLGVAGDVQCIGTSATIRSGEGKRETREEITDFATDLFGEPFSPEAVVEESRLPWDATKRDIDEADLPGSSLIHAEDIEGNLEELSDVRPLAESFLGEELSDVHSPEELGDVLYNHPTLAFLEEKCQEGPVSFRELVEEYRTTVRPQLEEAECHNELVAGLLLGTFAREERGGRVTERFVPRVHTFYSQGRSVVSCLSPEGPHLSDRGENVCSTCEEDRPTFPVLFCRNCGQEYYSVRVGRASPEPAEIDETDEDCMYLYPGRWDQEEVPIPDEWIASHGEIKSNYEDAEPVNTEYAVETNTVAPDDPDGTTREMAIVPAPFQLCLNCGISYTKNHGEFSKLFPIGEVGRSTATDVIVNSTMESLPQSERKMIVFSDNRQDTALQASHMNQLRRQVQFRRALFTAIERQESDVLPLEDGGYEVKDVLEETGVMQDYVQGESTYGVPPGAEAAWVKYLNYVAVEDLRKNALRLHQDLEDGGCLMVDFLKMDSFTRDEEAWQEHDLLSDAVPEKREDFLRGILSYMKDNLAIGNEFLLDAIRFENDVLNRINEEMLFDNGYYHRQWPAYELNDTTETSYVVDSKSFISSTTNTFQSWTKRFWNVSVDVARDLIRTTIEAVLEHTEYLMQSPDHSGFMLNPRSMVFRQLEDSTLKVCVDCGNVLHFSTTDDCYRMYCRTGGRTKDLSENYFRQEYLKEPDQTVQIEAAEHSGQLSGDERQQIEQNFEDEDDELNVIVCTPTMELGIDIGDLSAVLMRNIPPKPSNYAQRAGRAGRDAQPAVINNFCGSGQGRGPHDQYFYRFPRKIISGVIRAPRFHLDNPSLIRSHIHSYIWEVIPDDLPGENASLLNFEESDLPLFDDRTSDLQSSLSRCREEILSSIRAAFADEFEMYDWLDTGFVEETLDQFVHRLDASFDDLRDEYALLMREQNAIKKKLDRVEADTADTRRLNAIQSRLKNIKKGDSEFYPHKYLAARGFLPNYAFPRRQVTLTFSDRDDDMPRSDLRALTEFAPKNIVYLRGSQYMITHARPKHSEDEEMAYEGYRKCEECGSSFIGDEVRSMTNCLRCEEPFGHTSSKALEFPDMYARRFSRITIQEEERSRQGYRVTHQYTRREDATSFSCRDGSDQMTVTYENQGTIQAANHGLRSRDGTEEETGFHLCSRCNEWLLSDDALHSHIDPEDNNYCNNEAASEDVDRNIVLYTESTCDVLTIDVNPDREFDDQETLDSFLWSLAYTLKNAILFEFDLEEWEIDVFVDEMEKNEGSNEDGLSPRPIVLFEADEGGLGVLKDLTSENTFQEILARGLEILHAEDDDPCEKACYDCLLSYYNQLHHSLLDRTEISSFIERMTDVSLDQSSPNNDQRWKEYHEEADSSFEQDVLEMMNELGMNPPDEIHKLLTNPEGKPIMTADFFYEPKTVIMVDGSPHYKDYVQAGDEVKREAVRRMGYEIIELSGSDEEIREKLVSLNSS